MKTHPCLIALQSKWSQNKLYQIGKLLNSINLMDKTCILFCLLFLLNLISKINNFNSCFCPSLHYTLHFIVTTVSTVKNPINVYWYLNRSVKSMRNKALTRK